MKVMRTRWIARRKTRTTSRRWPLQPVTARAADPPPTKMTRTRIGRPKRTPPVRVLSTRTNPKARIGTSWRRKLCVSTPINF
ncbi:unnamed protein product [Dibothriocephalus latus]|uniref:Uncharacterized protein n=1 Tax=Dibothriocephalus latus TaxID=60516 RepID=A0A3P6S4W7_DIBLA|nr:unnamed protein product [Dibothriocephalus latus]